MIPITFFVPGIPKPAGSKRAFCLRKGGVLTGKAVVSDANPKSADWKNDVRQEAMKAYQGPLIDFPVELTLKFIMPRPRAHYGTGKNANVLKSGSPFWHIIKPDTLKLTRGVEDALTGIILKDDCIIVREILEKAYGPKPGVEVTIMPAPVRLVLDERVNQPVLLT